MADHDPTDDLQQIAGLAEQSARPLPAQQVRTLGDRRRNRRGLATVGIALATLLIVGGAVFTGLVLLRSPERTAGPPVAASPSAASSTDASGPSTRPSEPAARALTAKNLLTVDDVPLENYETQQVKAVRDGLGRPVPESSVCLPANGLADLGASQQLHRNFAYRLLEGKPDKDDPFAGQPVIYTQALQFADAAAAKAARDRYLDWLKSCPAQLKAKGYQLLPQLGFDPTKISVERGSATVTEIAYRRPGGADGDNGVWESVGLTVVGDRMMITVFLHWGMEWELTIDSTEGDLLHPQLGLCDAASERLSG